MSFEEVSTKEKNRSERQEWGREIEREIYLPFLTEILGDVFDFAIKTSDEVDGDVSEQEKLREQYIKDGKFKEAREIKNKIEYIKTTSPKTDIIARFKKDGSHLAIQFASFELNKGGEEKLEEKKECRRFKPIWAMDRIAKDSGYSPKNKGEWTPKIVVNFDHWAACDSQADWTRDGRKRRWFDYLREKNEKENNKYRVDILKQMIAELEDIIGADEFGKKTNKNYKPKYDCETFIRPKLEILRGALRHSPDLTPH